MSKSFAIGVDVGGTATKIALLDARGRIRRKVSVPTRNYRGVRPLVNAIAKEIEALLAEQGVAKSQVAGAGVGVPGLVDYKNGVVHSLTNVPGWHEVPLKRILRRKTGLPSFVDNDANVMALGELRFGAGKGASDVVCLTIGTGVGGGVIINGKLYRGKGFSAGEIGHIPINEDGPKCNCGSKGCIEAYVGNQYVARDVAKRLRRGDKSRVTDFVKRVEDVTPEILYRAAKAGDRFSRKAWDEIGTHLGIMLSGVVNLLNPERVVIGGGVSKAGKFLFEPVRRTIRKRAMPLPARTCSVVPAKLGEDAGVIGAAALVFENK